jgi:hypothetical protein
LTGKNTSDLNDQNVTQTFAVAKSDACYRFTPLVHIRGNHAGVDSLSISSFAPFGPPLK